MSPTEIVTLLRGRARALDDRVPVMRWDTDPSGRPGFYWVMPTDPSEADWVHPPAFPEPARRRR